jgi:hypothetical protein
MTSLRILVVVAALAAGTAGAAGAAPANVGKIAPPAIGEGEAATPVHWHRHCWPVRRWVWTHWGWRYRYVGHRCAPRYPYRYYHSYNYYPY